MAAAMQGQSPFDNEQAPVVQDHDSTREFKIDLDQLEANPDATTSAAQMDHYQSSPYESYQVEEPQPVVIDVDGETANEMQSTDDDFVEQIKSAIAVEANANDEGSTKSDELAVDDVIEFVIDQDLQISAPSVEMDENPANDLETALSKEEVEEVAEGKPAAKSTSSAKTKKTTGVKSSSSKKAPAKKASTASVKKSSAATKKSSPTKKPAAKKAVGVKKV